MLVIKVWGCVCWDYGTLGSRVLFSQVVVCVYQLIIWLGVGVGIRCGGVFGLWQKFKDALASIADAKES